MKKYKIKDYSYRKHLLNGRRFQRWFLRPIERFLAGKLCAQTDSGVGIGGPDGLQIPTPESVWGAEYPIGKGEG